MPKLSFVSHLSAGLSAVLVGYASSVVIILQAATAAGASATQIESWLLTLGLIMGLTSIGFSWYYKTPILTAWSTPGAAILVGSAAHYPLPTLIGAFIVTGILIFLTGLITPLARTLQRIPSALATAMLAAILLPFCLRAFEPVTSSPTIFGIMFMTYVLSKRFIPKYTMLLLLLTAVSSTFLFHSTEIQLPSLTLAQGEWVNPNFNLIALFNIAIPLYIVTMLSQNLPGIAMLKSYGYQPPIKPVLMGTGIVNAITAPFGGFSLNLAAISAAICMNQTVDKNKNMRYRAVLWAGVFYLLAGFLASTVVALFLTLPSDITHMLAGFALLGTLLMCLESMLQDAHFRESALLTFLITLSGANFLGISATLWGLCIGWVYYKIMQPLTKQSA